MGNDQEAAALVEPVAFLYKSRDGQIVVLKERLHRDGILRGITGWTETALYPAAAIERLTAQLAERDARIAELERSRAHILEDAKQGREAVRQLREDDKAQLAQAEADKAELMEALDEAYAELLADSVRDGPRCLLLTQIETTLAKHRKAST